MLSESSITGKLKDKGRFLDIAHQCSLFTRNACGYCLPGFPEGDARELLRRAELFPGTDGLCHRARLGIVRGKAEQPIECTESRTALARSAFDNGQVQSSAQLGWIAAKDIAPKLGGHAVAMMLSRKQGQISSRQRVIGIGLQSQLILVRRVFALPGHLLKKSKLGVQGVIVGRSAGLLLCTAQERDCSCRILRIGWPRQLRIGEAEFSISGRKTARHPEVRGGSLRRALLIHRLRDP